MKAEPAMGKTMNWIDQIRQKMEEIWQKVQDAEFQEFSREDYKFNYRAEHTRAVLAIGLGMGEKLQADMDVLAAAILLHDVGRSRVNKGHGEVGAQMAQEILQNSEFPPEKIDRVKYAIAVHVGWDESIPETLEARILWDADKLSKLGAIHILHQTMRLALKGNDSRQVAEKLKKWLETGEYIARHMKTDLGGQMASSRLNTLRMYVEALEKETEF